MFAIDLDRMEKEAHAEALEQEVRVLREFKRRALLALANLRAELDQLRGGVVSVRKEPG